MAGSLKEEEKPLRKSDVEARILAKTGQYG